MAISTIPQSVGSAGQVPTIQPEQPRGLTVRERFNALTARQRDEILDKYRDWNVEHFEWWDGVYDCFKADMDAIGIEVDKMYFSGFCSQGDGACFEGRVNDWDLFLRSLGYTDTALIQHAMDSFYFRVKHSGHYYHENCTQFTADLCVPDSADDKDFAERYGPYPWDADCVRTAAWMALLNQYDSTKLEDEFEEEFKRHMRALYSQLEAEYDHLTTDEAILDSLEANDQLEDAINSIIEESEEAYA